MTGLTRRACTPASACSRSRAAVRDQCAPFARLISRRPAAPPRKSQRRSRAPRPSFRRARCHPRSAPSHLLPSQPRPRAPTNRLTRARSQCHRHLVRSPAPRSTWANWRPRRCRRPPLLVRRLRLHASPRLPRLASRRRLPRQRSARLPCRAVFLILPRGQHLPRSLRRRPCHHHSLLRVAFPSGTLARPLPRSDDQSPRPRRARSSKRP